MIKYIKFRQIFKNANYIQKVNECLIFKTKNINKIVIVNDEIKFIMQIILDDDKVRDDLHTMDLEFLYILTY